MKLTAILVLALVAICAQNTHATGTEASKIHLQTYRKLENIYHKVIRGEHPDINFAHEAQASLSRHGFTEVQKNTLSYIIRLILMAYRYHKVYEGTPHWP